MSVKQLFSFYIVFVQSFGDHSVFSHSLGKEINLLTLEVCRRISCTMVLESENLLANSKNLFNVYWNVERHEHRPLLYDWNCEANYDERVNRLHSVPRAVTVRERGSTRGIIPFSRDRDFAVSRHRPASWISAGL